MEPRIGKRNSMKHTLTRAALEVILYDRALSDSEIETLSHVEVIP